MDPLCKARKGMSFTCMEQKTNRVAELLAHTAMTVRPLYTDASEYTEQNVLQEHLWSCKYKNNRVAALLAHPAITLHPLCKHTSEYREQKVLQ